MEPLSTPATQPGLRRPPRRPGGEVDPTLKRERIQKEGNLLMATQALAGEPLKPATVQERLRQERAQEALQALPGWRMTADGKALYRTREAPLAGRRQPLQRLRDRLCGSAVPARRRQRLRRAGDGDPARPAQPRPPHHRDGRRPRPCPTARLTGTAERTRNQRFTSKKEKDHA